MQPFHIYFVINKLTGKYYIGQTRQSVEVRWKQHGHDSRQKKGFYFYKALRKYGMKNFEIRTIFTCYDEETLNSAEKYFISFFDSANEEKGYNCTYGGEGGRKNDTARRNMSKAKIGKPNGRKGCHFSEQHKNNLRLAWKTRPPFSEETRIKLSEAGKKRPKIKTGKPAYNRGMKASEQAKQAMRDGWAKRRGVPTASRGVKKTKKIY